MAVEIERKFLIDLDKIGNLENGKEITQGYFDTPNGPTTRIRISGKNGFITIKGKTEGLSRSEYEYEIPLEDAKEMIEKFCPKTLSKTRYIIPIGNHKWEVDIFEGKNKGLIIAEIELESEDEEFIKPEWVGEEVSEDSRYYNSNLVENPYSNW